MCNIMGYKSLYTNDSVYIHISCSHKASLHDVIIIFVLTITVDVTIRYISNVIYQLTSLSRV